MKKVFGVAVLLLGFIVSLQSQDCNNQSTCTTPITALQICPQYCTLGADYAVNDIASLFECSLQIDNAQCISYLPLPGMENANAPDQVSITACDSSGTCETALVFVTTAVDCTNTNTGAGTAPPTPPANPPAGGVIAPDAVDDVFTLNCEAGGIINVLVNDTDSEGSFNICSFTQTAFGTLFLTGGSFTYTPVAGYTGTDSFTYTLCNSSGSDTANVSITITAGANTPPVASPDFGLTSSEALTIDVIANDSDADGDFISVCGNTQPSNGTVVQSGVSGFIYTPNPGFEGNDSFSYDVCDDSPCANGTSSGTVNITVEGGEVVCDNPEVCTTPSTPVEFCPVFCDLVGPFTITDASTTFNCSVVITGDCIIYTPLPGIPAGSQDQVSVTACTADGTCQTVVILVNILATCDDLPEGPVAVNDTVTTDGSTVSISPLDNDFSPDGLTIFICDFDNPSNGTVELIGDEFFYTPNPGFVGCDTFNYTICDSEGGMDVATITVCTEACVNQPLFSCTNLNTTVTLCADVLCGIDGAYVITSAVSSLNQGQAVAVVSDNCINYTPAPGFLGQDQVSITACATDAAGNPTAVCDEITANINVQEDCSNNSPPVAVDDMSSNFVNTVQIIDVLPNDFDPDGDTFTICDFTQPMNGTVALVDGMFVYTPNPDFAGLDSFTYTICDENGNMSTATVDITVLTGPLASIFVNDDAYEVEPEVESLMYVLDNDGFPGACDFGIEIVKTSENGEAWINIDGSISFKSYEGFRGETELTYMLTACGFSDVATVNIIVKSAEVELYIPNGFSPNGDGVNDEMRATGLDQFRDADYTARFVAFNRWGQTMYENNYVLETPGIWDGNTLPGKAAADGTYFYILEITNGVDEYRTAGFVELRR